MPGISHNETGMIPGQQGHPKPAHYPPSFHHHPDRSELAGMGAGTKAGVLEVSEPVPVGELEDERAADVAWPENLDDGLGLSCCLLPHSDLATSSFKASMAGCSVEATRIM